MGWEKTNERTMICVICHRPATFWFVVDREYNDNPYDTVTSYHDNSLLCKKHFKMYKKIERKRINYD